MSFQERSYGGKIFRPRPEFFMADDGSFGVIATPWGNQASAQRAIEILRDFILSARQDREATSPFQKLTCLTPLANNLRVALMLANDSLYREENKSEYTAGVEVFVFAHAQGELAYAQVGSPQFLVAREGMPWIPVSVQIDMATELSVHPELLAPLPQNLIGLHTTTNMNVASIRTQPHDRLVFLSHSVISHPLFGLSHAQTNIESISSTLANQFPDQPFWVGVLDL